MFCINFLAIMKICKHHSTENNSQKKTCADLLTFDHTLLLCVGIINHHLSNNHELFHFLCNVLTVLLFWWKTLRVCVPHEDM